MRRRGLSARLRLTLSYAALVVVVGAILLAVVFVFLLRYVPEGNIVVLQPGSGSAIAPDRNDLLAAFVPAATLACAALFALGMLGGWFLAGRVLRPLTEISDAARRAASGSLSHRIGSTGPHDEFRDVADTFDAMLTRIERNVAGYRRFAADASHELRTPLATTRAILDVAAADPDVDTGTLVARLSAANDRAVAVTEALLLIARTDAAPPERTTVDLALVLEDAVETFAGLAESRGTALHLGAQPAWVSGNEPLLLHLAANLVQNAVVHNTGAGGWVRASTDATGAHATLTVENTGRRLTPEDVALLTEPFRRGEGRTRSADHAGAGLGLAIATSIVDALGGTLTLVPRADGGLVATARFPAVPAPTTDD
ncbi:sensor histidine kinase [Sanguibacter suaedae]|uniref:histidine kinase n=1 Tax=Sanguibacter suaedae TaxID=2795737 RepID=A0A934I7K4_9MICO|nr:HAMP domain-containing sensor histidine kinase [Sanguibacter suaedae]MBI9113675.1 HAMP domain-containing histidine kinase [Sanguibacter suaedae]